MMDGGQLTTGGADPINFASQFSFLTAYATQLGQLTANSTVNNNGYGTITLTGTDPTLEIFDLPIADLGGSNALDINVNASATVLINVMGISVTTSNSGFFLNGTQNIGNGATGYEHILFNFYQATSINFGGTFQGTVLAPNASVTGGGGQIDGGLIAQSYSGNLEFHDLLFNGSLPAPVPEPSPLILCGIGLLLVGLGRYRR
jgi:choice-of-anchor A domain-containing protein